MLLTVWLGLTVAFVIIEIITLGLTTIWFAGGSLVAAIATCFGLALPGQIVIFSVVSLILLVFTRPVVAKYFIKTTEKTNVDSLLGMECMVTETIDNLKGTGVAKLKGLEWTARSVDNSIIEVGETVIVDAIDGVKLIVKK